MLYSLSEVLAICGRQVTSSQLDSITLGLVLPALVESSAERPQSLRLHIEIIQALLAAKQIEIVFDRFGEFCGCAAWAWVAGEVRARLLRDGAGGLQPQEVSGGEHAWLLNLIAHHGELPLVLERMRDDWLGGVASLIYSRSRRGRRVVKMISRESGSYFFKKPACANGSVSHFLRSHEAGGLRHAAIGFFDNALELGEVLQLACHVPAISSLPVPAALARLRPPLMQMQRRFYRDAGGVLCGYLSWAWMADDMIANRIPDAHQLAPFQWNDGRNFVLCDAMATNAGLALMRADMTPDRFPTDCAWLADRAGRPQALSLGELDAEAAACEGAASPADMLQRLRGLSGALS